MHRNEDPTQPKINKLIKLIRGFPAIGHWGCFKKKTKPNGSVKKSKKKSEHTSRQMTINTQVSKIYGTQQKQF